MNYQMIYNIASTVDVNGNSVFSVVSTSDPNSYQINITSYNSITGIANPDIQVGCTINQLNADIISFNNQITALQSKIAMANQILSSISSLTTSVASDPTITSVPVFATTLTDKTTTG